MELIDKAAVVAEIEKLKYIIMPYPTMAEKVAYRDGIEDTIKIVIKFLEVKEVDLDMEIDLWIRNLHSVPNFEELNKFARHFFELGLKAKE